MQKVDPDFCSLDRDVFEFFETGRILQGHRILDLFTILNEKENRKQGIFPGCLETRDREGINHYWRMELGRDYSESQDFFGLRPITQRQYLKLRERKDEYHDEYNEWVTEDDFKYYSFENWVKSLLNYYLGFNFEY